MWPGQCETRTGDPFERGLQARHVAIIITGLSMQGSCQVYSKNDLWLWEGIQIAGIKQRMHEEKRTCLVLSFSSRASCFSLLWFYIGRLAKFRARRVLCGCGVNSCRHVRNFKMPEALFRSLPL
jgi:hypothetical protein